MTLMARIRFSATSFCQKHSTERVGQICFPPPVSYELCAVAHSHDGIAVAFPGLPCSAEFGFASKIHEIGAEFTKYMKLVLGLQIHFGESREMPRGRCAETFLW